MQKRICPNCLTRWYSSDSSQVWKCESCGHDIPVLLKGEIMKSERKIPFSEIIENDLCKECCKECQLEECPLREDK